ncbi:MAG: dihydrodipicolinate synthase family protein [Rhodocyclaceae bacterium]|nr:dihydrodipicolinate synthase family protein [Rhodocyclaceae bacterium]
MGAKLLKGIVPVVVVPMHPGGEPDIEGTHRLVNFLVDSGVGGMWVLGSASEDVNMSVKQRLAVARATAEANAGRVPLIVGSGLTSIGDILDYADQLSDLSFHGLHVLPYDVKMGDARLIHLIETLADRLPWPVWMYHNPKRGRAFTDDIIGKVKAHPNVGGIKIGGYNLSELTRTIMHRTEDFDVIGAGGGQLFQMLALGAQAHTTSEASVFPERFIALMAAFEQGRIDEAREMQFDLIRLSKAIPRTENGEYCAEEKFMLSLRGICGEAVNPLYRTLNDEEKRKIRQLLVEHRFEWASA